MTAKRKPRWQADPSAIYRVMGGQQLYTQAEQDKLALPVAIAIAAMTHGTGTSEDHNTIAVIANTCLVLAEKIDPKVVEMVIEAQDALMRSEERHARTGRWGLDEPGMQAVRDCLDLYRQLLAALTPKQLQDGLNTVIKRLNAGHHISLKQTTQAQQAQKA